MVLHNIGRSLLIYLDQIKKDRNKLKKKRRRRKKHMVS